LEPEPEEAENEAENEAEPVPDPVQEECTRDLCICPGPGPAQCVWERYDDEPEAEIANGSDETENRAIGQNIVTEQLAAIGVNNFAIRYGNGNGYMQGNSSVEFEFDSQTEAENSFEAHGITSHPVGLPLTRKWTSHRQIVTILTILTRMNTNKCDKKIKNSSN
jgi:hypothetical protein